MQQEKAQTTKQRPSWTFILQIFLTFLKIGPVTFGGGYAMIPMIEREVVDRKKWIKPNDVTEVFAISESVPGAIAINSATFIGFRLAGVRGAVAAMLGVLLPTFLIVVGLSMLFILVKDNPYIEAAFIGIRSAIVALIVYAAYKIGLTAIYDKTTLTVMVITVAILFFLHIHPVLIIIGGMGVGILLVQIRKKLGIFTAMDKEESKQKAEIV
ncbi:chromate transporter [Saliterribacillus persicus]|uniref:Chromate transporter n=1 Tax=Saliterribacillus persicus TaxID=930114 RepID=A0A368YCT9_9BACI|nr:chromate transporter [Saliterribacillus persicus]RCW77248.1 chromate transporter [Saliterribacillus persicus]